MYKVTFKNNWGNNLRKTVTANTIGEAWEKVNHDHRQWTAWEIEKIQK